MVKLLRTDGGGSSTTDERLELLYRMIKHWLYMVDVDKWIAELHDHEGDLTVTWFYEPNKDMKKVVKEAWEYLSEYNIEHVVDPHYWIRL